MPVWQFLRTWTFDPYLAQGIVVCAVAYVWAVLAVNRRSPQRAWPVRRTASFLGALALTWFVLLGPVGAYDDTFFWAHMTQHIALMMVIAPLLLLGSPVLLLLRAVTPRFRRRWVVPVLHSRALHTLTHPVLTWVVFAGVLIGTHFTPFYEFALQHPNVHLFVEHPLYLGAGLLFYYPLLDANPVPRRIPPAHRVISLFLMMVPETMTGFFLYASGYLLYPYYLTVDRPFGPSPLTDQQLGGALMWAGGMAIDVAWLALATAEWFRSEARRTERLDAQLARELAGAPGAEPAGP
jgi:putative membrane protein